MLSLGEFCGQDDLYFFREHDFGLCFMRGALLGGSQLLHALVAVACVAQLAASGPRALTAALSPPSLARDWNRDSGGVLLRLALLTALSAITLVRLGLGAESLCQKPVFIFFATATTVASLFSSIAVWQGKQTHFSTDGILAVSYFASTCALLVVWVTGVWVAPPKRSGQFRGGSTFQIQDNGEDEALLPSATQGSGASAAAREPPNYGAVSQMGARRPPEDEASPLSFVLFTWVSPLMVYGYLKRTLLDSDLLGLPQSLNTARLEETFRRNLAEEIDAERRLPPPVRKRHFVLSTFNRSFGWSYYPLGILKMTSDLAGFAGPILLNHLVDFIENGSQASYRGYMYAGLLCASSLVGAILNSQFTFLCNKAQVSIRAAVVTTIFNKSLSSRLLSGSSSKEKKDAEMAKEKQRGAGSKGTEASPETSTSSDKAQTAASSERDQRKAQQRQAKQEQSKKEQEAKGSQDPTFSSTGEVMNVMSTDCDRLANFAPSFHAFWSLPVQIVVALYLLYNQVGISFLAGLTFAIVLIPLNRKIASRIGTLSTEMMKQKDARVKIVNELLHGIRVVKMYAWERNFEERIAGIRAKELDALRGRKYLDAVCVYLWAATPVIISILTFATYSLLGHKLTAGVVFTSMALFNMLIGPLNAFPWVLNGMVEAWVSLSRVEAYLRLPDIRPVLGLGTRGVGTSGEGRGDASLDAFLASGIAPSDDATLVEIVDGTFTWTGPESASSSPTQQDPSLKLQNINLAVRAGELLCVSGEVGSGKSSLLQAILGEMLVLRGTLRVDEDVLRQGIGYVAQEPWIQNATVRDNILFGSPMDDEFYAQVLYACALDNDLQQLPGGDLTEIGENGINLSGGQKARVALARAVYQRKQLYLLDDPLAALDPHVAKHVLQHCFLGLLRGSSRILCTHNEDALRAGDRVLAMSHGVLREGHAPAAQHHSLEPQSRGDEASDAASHSQEPAQPPVSSAQPREPAQPPSSEQSRGQGRQPSIDADATASVKATSESSQRARMEDDKLDSGRLTTAEERSAGTVSLVIYKKYWIAVGSALSIGVLLSLLLMQGSRNVSDWWLSYWVTHAKLNQSHETQHFLEIYGGISAANTVFTLVRAFLFAYAGICAARILHEQLLHSIFHSRVFFFDSTPIGRIVNRFSSDVYGLDDSLPFIMNIFFAQAFGLLGTIAITCYGLPYFSLCLPPLGVIYYFIQKYYRQTSREIKRIGSVSRSPIYAHFSETLTGIVTLRALRAAPRFAGENRERLEANQVAWYNEQAVSQWLGVRLQLMGVSILTAVGFLAAAEHHFGHVNAGLVGLSISYALSVNGLLQGLVTAFTETEKEMVAVERVEQYIHNELEADDLANPYALVGRPNWPEGGELVFERVDFRYRHEHAPILRDVNLYIPGGKRVGIVGRTGAGKSSLFQALFRMAELSRGRISLDGIDCATVPLETLRERLAIIPQDPVLFSGNVRDNMDPFGVHTDEEVWRALEECELAHTLRASSQGLGMEVEEKGRNFSLGQRQLLCLGRALLKRPRVICIDEATANVDHATDALIQRMLRTQFANSTVLTIAHRMSTILDSDLIVVMDAGRVAEWGAPASLLAREESIFRSLVQNV